LFPAQRNPQNPKTSRSRHRPQPREVADVPYEVAGKWIQFGWIDATDDEPVTRAEGLKTPGVSFASICRH